MITHILNIKKIQSATSGIERNYREFICRKRGLCLLYFTEEYEKVKVKKMWYCCNWWGREQVELGKNECLSSISVADAKLLKEDEPF